MKQKKGLGHAIRKGVILTALPFLVLSGFVATGGEMKLTQEKLHEFFEYKPSGELIWKKQTSNRAVVGSLAGCMKSDGYLKIGFGSKKFKRSRLNFMYHYGYMPACVDHINGNTADDRIENLRDATRGLNAYNKSKMANNSSGKAGVTFHTRTQTWRARINLNGKEISLGYHKTFDEALEARLKGEMLHYGELARA